jgi:hypothetical protein
MWITTIDTTRLTMATISIGLVVDLNTYMIHIV